MNKSELLQGLKDLKINPDAYAVTGGSPSETYVLSDEGYGKWAVYYSERGGRNNEMLFQSESAACDELYRRVTSDPSTRWHPSQTDHCEAEMSVLGGLHEKSAFDSAWEHEQFEKLLDEMLKRGLVIEIPVEVPTCPLRGHEEHWYKDHVTGEVYRYVPPEFPARGIWEKI